MKFPAAVVIWVATQRFSLLLNGSKDCVTTHNDCVSCWDQAPRWGIGQIEGNTEKKVQRANPGGLLLKEPGPRLQTAV